MGPCKRKIYTKEVLDTLLTRDNAIPLEQYIELSSLSMIKFKCNCNIDSEKRFVSLVTGDGAFCKQCMTIKKIEKTKKTNMEKYGVENPFQCPDIIKKIKETNMEKYGVESPLQSHEIKIRVKQTCLTKYGVENPSQNQVIKAKKNESYINHYGMHPKKVKEVNDKYKKTCLEKYGVENTSQVPEIKEKIKNIFVEKYGGHPMHNEIVKQKVVDTCLQRYGTHPCKTQQIKIKTEEVFLNKYGCYPTQNSKIMQKVQQNGRKYKKYTLPSGKIINIQGYENYAMDELIKLYSEEDIISDRKDIPRIQYKYQEKDKYYFPDIYIPKENKIIEVKSDWTYSNDIVIINLKAEATKTAGYIYEIWVYNRKGERINTIV